MSSELQVNTITEATSGSGITFAKDIIPATPLSHRNMIINGAMQVNQRGTADATNSNGYPVDRFRGRVNAMDNLVIGLSQENDAPAGFTKSVKLNVNTASVSPTTTAYSLDVSFFLSLTTNLTTPFSPIADKSGS